MAETQSRDAKEKIKTLLEGGDLFPKDLIDIFESTPQNEKVPFYFGELMEALKNSRYRAAGEKIVADLKERRELPKILIETLENMKPQDVPVFINSVLENFYQEGGESEDECEEESKEKSKE